VKVYGIEVAFESIERNMMIENLKCQKCGWETLIHMQNIEWTPILYHADHCVADYEVQESEGPEEILSTSPPSP